MSLTLLACLALSAPAIGADPPPIPKPDPPPRVPPPPPQPVTPQPPPPAPVVQPPPVAAPSTATPSVTQPTAAERRAEAARRALAARLAAAGRARVKAVEAAREMRIAAGQMAAVPRRQRARAPIAPANDTPSSGWGAPFLLAAFGSALLLLGLALTPAWAVPWRPASRALDERRDELGVLGAMGIAASLIFFLLVQVTT